jgi:lipopolysaccharide cholinephosphotransferase
MSNLRKLQLMELDILRQVTETCNRHGLRYYLLGGTFLGAVRHQGFIPWDDDIDIGMPRADFEKFCRLAEQQLEKPLGFVSYKNNPEHIYFHPRVYNFNSRVIDRSGVEEKETHAWIDIFPLDGMPGNKVIRKLHGFRLLFLRLLFMYSQFDKIVAVSVKKRVWYEQMLVNIGKVIKFDNILNTKKIMHKIDRTLKHLDYETSSYVGNFMGAYRMREVFPKQFYEEIAEYPFDTEIFTVK